MTSLFRYSVIAAAICSAVVVVAQSNPAPTLTLKLASQAAAAGKPLQATLTVTFAEGLHGYQNPPTDPTLIPVVVKLADKTFSLVSVKYPKGTPAKVGGEDKPINVYQGTIQIPITLKAPAKLGKTTLKVSFDYQQCNETACFPPGSVSAEASVVVLKTLPPAKPTKAIKGKA